MDKLLEHIKKNKGAFAAVLVIFVIFLVLSGMRFMQIHSGDSDGDELTQDEQLEQDANAQLTDDQIAKRDNYSDTTKELINLLKSQTWGAGGSSPYISFTDTTFTETNTNQDPETTAYVVDVTEKNTTQASDPEIVTYTASVETADKSFFVELVRETAKDGKVTLSVSSSGFAASQDAYTPVKPSSQYTVSGLNSDVLKLVDDKKDELNKAVTEYCTQHYPTATSITWDKTADIDWETNVVTLSLKTEDSETGFFYVFYDRNDKTFSVSTSN